MAGSTASTGGGGGSGGTLSAISEVAKLLESNYRKTTPRRLRMLDMFLVFVFATGVLQVRGRRCKALVFPRGGRLLSVLRESVTKLFMGFLTFRVFLFEALAWMVLKLC